MVQNTDKTNFIHLQEKQSVVELLTYCNNLQCGKYLWKAPKGSLSSDWLAGEWRYFLFPVPLTVAATAILGFFFFLLGFSRKADVTSGATDSHCKRVYAHLGTTNGPLTYFWGFYLDCFSISLLKVHLSGIFFFYWAAFMSGTSLRQVFCNAINSYTS